jgi:hypothetical protein
MDSTGSGYGPVAGSCGHGNEPSCSIKGGEFLHQFSDKILTFFCKYNYDLLLSFPNIHMHTGI